MREDAVGCEGQYSPYLVSLCQHVDGVKRCGLEHQERGCGGKATTEAGAWVLL